MKKTLTQNEIKWPVEKVFRKVLIFLGIFLLPAFTSPYKDFFTDEASVVEYAGNLIHLIEGEENNIKITYPMDLVLAEKILAI